MMSPQIFDKRPPFVQWAWKEYGRDVAASEAAGRPVPKNVLFALITPHGSKDVLERVAEDWLAQIKRQAAEGQYPPEWARIFRESHDAFLKGEELPREGTPIQTWQMLNGEQRMRMKAVGMTTVEDLAMVPDSGLNMLGLDGRYLRDTARNWIDEGKTKGAVSGRLAETEQKLEAAQKTIAEQRAMIDRMAERLDALEGGGGKGSEDRSRKRA